MKAVVLVDFTLDINYIYLHILHIHVLQITYITYSIYTIYLCIPNYILHSVTFVKKEREKKFLQIYIAYIKWSYPKKKEIIISQYSSY